MKFLAAFIAAVAFLFAEPAMAVQTPPDQTVTVVPVGTYGPGTKTWVQRSIPDTIHSAQLAIDVTNRPAGTAVDLTLSISYDSGVTWDDYTAHLGASDANAASNEVGIALSGIPMTAGRLVKGQASITGQGFQTSMVARLWLH